MLRTPRLWLAAGTGVAALGAMLLVPGQLALSADHLDPPLRTDPAADTTPDIPADIADIFAFHDANNLYLISTFGGPAAPTLGAFYDRDILHTINVSTSPPATSSDITIRFRFGPGANPGETGISVENLPGVNGALVGPVEQILSKDGVRVYAGLRDDPFFFDSQGLRESRTMGTIRFNSNRSFFHAKNITTVAIEIPRSRLGTATNLDIWNTTARFGGQL
jgi:hypothetical protein